MEHYEQRLRVVHEHQARLRAEREAERMALASHVARRSVRRQVGESLVRLGLRVAGTSHTSPAWTG